MKAVFKRERNETQISHWCELDSRSRSGPRLISSSLTPKASSLAFCQQNVNGLNLNVIKAYANHWTSVEEVGRLHSWPVQALCGKVEELSMPQLRLAQQSAVGVLPGVTALEDTDSACVLVSVDALTKGFDQLTTLMRNHLAGSAGLSRNSKTDVPSVTRGRHTLSDSKTDVPAVTRGRQNVTLSKAMRVDAKDGDYKPEKRPSTPSPAPRVIVLRESKSPDCWDDSSAMKNPRKRRAIKRDSVGAQPRQAALSVDHKKSPVLTETKYENWSGTVASESQTSSAGTELDVADEDSDVDILTIDPVSEVASPNPSMAVAASEDEAARVAQPEQPVFNEPIVERQLRYPLAELLSPFGFGRSQLQVDGHFNGYTPPGQHQHPFTTDVPCEVLPLFESPDRFARARNAVLPSQSPAHATPSPPAQVVPAVSPYVPKYEDFDDTSQQQPLFEIPAISQELPSPRPPMVDIPGLLLECTSVHVPLPTLPQVMPFVGENFLSTNDAVDEALVLGARFSPSIRV
eukprot:TRINITY_DN4208_c0_g1_i1.p1 TRINITY_DN4208_c0_g1~~TRINITY_DN4208_c0_g1_i1.p1  ORF type:complete len:537 (+),score=65.93 TRINITY_DN4208_c0_g1_i1:63-1613(+)